MVTCSCPSPKQEGIFLWSSKWDPWKCGRSSKTGPLTKLVSEPPAAHQSTSPLMLSFTCFYRLVAPWLLLQVSPSQQWFSGFASLSRFWGGGLPCDLNSLIDLREVTDLQFVQLFSCEDNSDNFQALYILEAAVEFSSHFLLRLFMLSWKSPSPGTPPPCSSPDLPLSNLVTQLSSQHLVLPSLLFWIHSYILFGLHLHFATVYSHSSIREGIWEINFFMGNKF